MKTPTGRLYGDYHAKVLQIVNTVLHDRNICFDFIKAGDKIDTDSDCLLVVWSEDFLSATETATTINKIYQDFIYKLSSCTRPVLWLTAVDQAYLDFEKIGANIHFLHYGGDMMFEMKEYSMIAPQRGKSFDVEDTSQWISLNLEPRPHRILAACCLMEYGLGVQALPANRGLLRISNWPIIPYESIEEYVKRSISGSLAVNTQQTTVWQKGFVRLKQHANGGPTADKVYDNSVGCQNSVNFDRSLRFLYRNTMIEIVNETTFFSKGIFVTEKFQNSVYGFNLPIILSNAGTVSYLRAHGFDMFDDVINHVYDCIEDPMKRIHVAIEKNLNLLTDFDHARRCYQHCLPRLEQNYQFIRHDMHNHFLDYFRQNLQNYLDNHAC